MATPVTHPELEPGDELPLEWWPDDYLANLIDEWRKEIEKDT
jgi:hypothetical protein